MLSVKYNTSDFFYLSVFTIFRRRVISHMSLLCTYCYFLSLFQVNAGDNLESERYLITVEAVKVNEKPCEDQPRKAEIIEVNRNGVKPGILPSRHLSVGLKRKFTVCLSKKLFDIDMHFKTQRSHLLIE